MNILIFIVAICSVSYIFNISFLISSMIIAVFGLFGEIVHLPENLPGKIDNPDGKSIHPWKAITIGTAIIFILFALGYAFPSLYQYGW